MPVDREALEQATTEELAWVEQHWNSLQYVFKNKKYDKAPFQSEDLQHWIAEADTGKQKGVLSYYIAWYRLALAADLKLREATTTDKEIQENAREAVAGYAATGLLYKRLEEIAKNTTTKTTPNAGEIAPFLTSQQTELDAYPALYKKADRLGRITGGLVTAAAASTVFTLGAIIAVGILLAAGTGPLALIALPIALLAATIALIVTTRHVVTKKTIPAERLLEEAEEALVSKPGAIAAARDTIAQQIGEVTTPTDTTAASSATHSRSATPPPPPPHGAGEPETTTHAAIATALAVASSTTPAPPADSSHDGEPPTAAAPLAATSEIPLPLPRSSSSSSLRFHKKGEHDADTASGAASPTDQQKPGA